jgi:hypothetical protein
MSTIDRTLPTGALRPAVTAQRSAVKGSRMTYSRLIGALFLLGFLFYGVGTALVTSVLGAPDFLSTIAAHQTTLALGVLLMLLNSVAVVGLGVLFFPILESHGKRTALAYLAARIVEAILLAIGALSVLMILPLGQRAVDAGEASAAWANALGSLAIRANSMSYQVAEMALCLASVFLCSLLLRTRLIPRFLAVGGVIGYAIFLAGTIAELFGSHIGLMLSIPGGLFELGLGFWLLIKGFQPAAYGQEA